MSLRRIVLFCAALVVVLAGCANSTGGEPRPQDSGIRGRAMVDGGCPVVRKGEPCPSRPLSAEIVVTASGSDTPVATVVSEQDGRFELALPPGTYAVSGRAADGGPLPFAKTVEVTVRDGAFTWQRVSFDSGIR
jgi:hypothetical protein